VGIAYLIIVSRAVTSGVSYFYFCYLHVHHVDIHPSSSFIVHRPSSISSRLKHEQAANTTAMHQQRSTTIATHKIDMCRWHSHVHLHKIGRTPIVEFAFLQSRWFGGGECNPYCWMFTLRWTMSILILTSTLKLITIVFFGGGNEILHTECSTTDRSMNSNGSITQFNGCSDNQRNTTKATQSYNSRGMGIVRGSHLMPLLYTSTGIFQCCSDLSLRRMINRLLFLSSTVLLQFI
jgi:hypothetical protein